MPTDYYGSRTAAQAPGVVPAPEAIPRILLPADGDPPNGSTYAQPLRALADHLHWLFRPVAKALAWAQPIVRYYTAGGHAHFLVDHMGYPGGRILAWEETWRDNGVRTGALGDVPLFPTTATGWFVNTNGAGSAVYTGTGAGLPADRLFPAALIQAGDNSGDFASLYRKDSAPVASSALQAAYEFEFRLSSAAPGDITYFAGLVGGVGSEFPSLGGASHYASFRKVVGSNFWQTATRGGGSEVAIVTTADALNTDFHRGRIEYHGHLASDDGIAAVRFYIDGALVSTHTAELPVSTLNPHFSVLMPSSTPCLPMHIGPSRWRSNLYGSDVI